MRGPRARDPRIDTRVGGWAHYLVAFLVLTFILAAYTVIYLALGQAAATAWDNTVLALALLGYVLFASLVLLGAFAVARERVLLRPTRILGEAARKVAQGDYSVRVGPLRHDGRKDEFEVLFDDFNTMVEELASTEILKTDFVSNVSHELKTPLAVIQNQATMLQSDALSEGERRVYAAGIAEASERLSVLVTNILQLSRLENQKIPFSPAPYNLSEQLSRCVLAFDELWDEKGLDLVADLDETIVLLSDEGLLDVVWNNLISNAIKFTEPGGSVTIRAQRAGDQARVSVEDSGCGMSEADARRVFDRFYQADGSHATEGNGLGLSIASRILDLAGGTIEVASVLGRGTTFTVSLPVGPA